MLNKIANSGVSQVRASLRGVARRVLPQDIYRRLVLATRYPPVGRIDFGTLRSLTPVSSVWGLDRGKAVDRYYIEAFLAANSDYIKGHVLEIGNNRYTRRFGGQKVTKSDVLHVSAEHAEATIIADLRDADHVPSATFDCIICTQTLHLIYEIDDATSTLHRLLKPGGVLLLTLPGISQISRYDMDRWGDYWRFTVASARRLLSNHFSAEDVEIEHYGNVLTATAFLHGVAAEELTRKEREHRDQDYQVLIAVRAVRSTPLE